MNTEDFVTFEKALALKRLGFDYSCDYYYIESTYSTFDRDGETHVKGGGELMCRFSKYFVAGNCVEAPTLAQAQKWLREEKGLYLIWDMGQDKKHNSKFAWYVCDCHGYIVDVLASEVKYNSPEEALSAGITECLKFLEKEN